MDCFKWGHAFYSVNDELLRKYEKCSNSTEVVAEQNKYLEAMDSKDDGNYRGKLSGTRENLYCDLLVAFGTRLGHVSILT